MEGRRNQGAQTFNTKVMEQFSVKVISCWWKCKLMQPLWKTVQRCFRKLKQSCHTTQQSHSWAYTEIKL